MYFYLVTWYTAGKILIGILVYTFILMQYSWLAADSQEKEQKDRLL